MNEVWIRAFHDFLLVTESPLRLQQECRRRNFPFRKQAMPFSQHLENFSTNFSLLN